MKTPKTLTKTGNHPVPAVPAALHGDRALAHFAPQIAALEGTPLEPFRGDAQLWSHNARLGIEAVLPHLHEVPAKLPQVKLAEVLEVPNVIRALAFAAGRIGVRGTATRAQIDERYARLQSLRGPVMMMAQVFAAPVLGDFDAAAVADIVAGNGLYNHAQDGIALAALFREHHAKIVGRHPFTAAQLAQLEQDGVWLSEHVTPDGARPPPSDRTMERQRDALAELARRRHEQLRLVGIALFGEDGVDANVPKLGSRTFAKAGDAATSGASAPSAPKDGQPTGATTG